MTAPEDPKSRLEALGEEIRAARKTGRPRRNRMEGKFRAASIAIRMVTELVVGIAIGAAMGYGLDSLFGSMPLFLVVFGMFGFAAGVKVVLRSADELNRQAARARDDGKAENGPDDGSAGRRG